MTPTYAIVDVIASALIMFKNFQRNSGAASPKDMAKITGVL